MRTNFAIKHNNRCAVSTFSYGVQSFHREPALRSSLYSITKRSYLTWTFIFANQIWNNAISTFSKCNQVLFRMLVQKSLLTVCLFDRTNLVPPKSFVLYLDQGFALLAGFLFNRSGPAVTAADTLQSNTWSLSVVLPRLP